MKLKFILTSTMNKLHLFIVEELKQERERERERERSIVKYIINHEKEKEEKEDTHLNFETKINSISYLLSYFNSNLEQFRFVHFISKISFSLSLPLKN
jgi:hypothetical protein